MKTSRHIIKFANSKKLDKLLVFLTEYRRCAGILVDYLWENGYKWTDSKNNNFYFLPKSGLLEAPLMITSDIITKANLSTFLTGRSLKCLLTQIAGMLRGECEKQRKRLFMLKKAKAEGKSKKHLKLLIQKIKKNNPVKPNTNHINAELNSICCDYKESKSGEFNGFLKLRSITKSKIEISLPIKFSRHSIKLSKNCKLKKSFLIGECFIDFRWEAQKTQIKSGATVGADQGMKDVFVLSNGVVTKKYDLHGHSLESIMNKANRKKKGSKSFRRTKEHQKNFVNWSINQLNLSGIGEIRLEKIWNIGFKSKLPRKLSHWQNTVIRDKIKSKCEEEGIRFILQSCVYRSQRCSECGNVRKSNRKGKIYTCKRCHFFCDADLNAAKNHEVNLPDVPYELRKSRLNLGDGFLWAPSGFFNLNGGSLQSPPKQIDKYSHIFTITVYDKKV